MSKHHYFEIKVVLIRTPAQLVQFADLQYLFLEIKNFGLLFREEPSRSSSQNTWGRIEEPFADRLK